MPSSRFTSVQRDEAAPSERVRSRSPVARDEEDNPFSLVVKKKSGMKKREVRRRLQEEAELLREKAMEERLPEEMELERRRSEERRKDRETLECAKVPVKVAGKRVKSPSSTGTEDCAARDRVKHGTKELYVVCTDLRSGPKRIKREITEEAVPVHEVESAPVTECISVVNEMHSISRDMRGLVLGDLNKVPKWVADRILDQASKYETLIQRVNLENERLRGCAEAYEQMNEKLVKVSDDVNLVVKNVSRVNDICKDLSARTASAPSGAKQGSVPPGQPKSFAVIVRGANKDLSTAEVKQRLDESVCPELDVCVRSIRPVRGGGGGGGGGES